MVMMMMMMMMMMKVKMHCHKTPIHIVLHFASAIIIMLTADFINIRVTTNRLGIDIFGLKNNIQTVVVAIQYFWNLYDFWPFRNTDEDAESEHDFTTLTPPTYYALCHRQTIMLRVTSHTCMFG